MWYIYTIKYYSALRKRKSGICYNWDKSWKYYVKWRKADRERQMFCGISYI